jgi:protein phosphatase
LSDLLTLEQILPLQIVHWLYEITELWMALKPYQCRQSLLEFSNLRVDEDHILCLKRLYLDYPDQEIGPTDLGRVWRMVLQRANWRQTESLMQLTQRLEAGEIQSLDEVRAQLEIIADQLQVNGMNMPEMIDHSAPNLFDDISDEDSDEDTVPMDESSQFAHNADPVAADLEADRELAQQDLDSSDSELTDDESTPYSDFRDDGDSITGDTDDVPTVVLPMQLFSLTDAGRTDIGRQRDHNEDCFSIHTQIQKIENPAGRILQAKGLYILCDGMGGHEGGEVASALAVETLKRYFETHWTHQLPSEDEIREAIGQANQKIYELNQNNACHGSGRMGTTLVVLVVQDTKAAIAHVGDSRLYALTRKRGLEQLTIDHDVGQREIIRGVEPAVAYARPDAYQLTQALGPRDNTFINPDVQFVDLNEDTLFILCSDGLTDNDLLEQYSTEFVEPLLSSQGNLEQGITQLIDLANQYNGHDNITVILVRAKLRPYLEALRAS